MFHELIFFFFCLRKKKVLFSSITVRLIKLCDFPFLLLSACFDILISHQQSFPTQYYRSIWTTEACCSALTLHPFFVHRITFYLCRISVSVSWTPFVAFLFLFREAMKVNGQMDCHPSAKGVTASPNRHGNVKKVTGVGGTTYEISVWAGTPNPPSLTRTTFSFFFGELSNTKQVLLFFHHRISLLVWFSWAKSCVESNYQWETRVCGGGPYIGHFIGPKDHILSCSYVAWTKCPIPYTFLLQPEQNVRPSIWDWK